MQLKVVKADGSIEEYLHTKVLGTISNALASTNQPDVCVAEQLSEAVTYFLYHRKKTRSVTSSEILSMVKAVLAATGYVDAAEVLSEHQYHRKLRRARIEVVSVDAEKISDVEMFYGFTEPVKKCRWDKSVIVANLVNKHGIARQTARMIASMVEEKVLNIGITLVPASLVKQLVLGDAATVMRAQRQLQTV